MDASQAFANNVANLKFEDIPDDAVRAAKISILDTLGIILAASSLATGSRELVDFVKEGGGKEESSILGFGGKVPSYMAALANGAMAHSLDYDDVHESAQVHAGVTIVPGSLAVAERVGKVDGKQFITAVVLGADFACRLSLAAAPRPRGWQPTPVFGFFGVAAAASKFLGLNAETVQNALGIAYSQAAGNAQPITDAALTKRTQAGFAAKGGIISALMAQKGITGATNSLEGEFGFYKVYWGGKYNREVLTGDLGKRFEVSNLTFKPYPSGRSTHSSIDATLAMVRENDLKPQDIESITVSKSAIAVKVVGSPIERKRRPENVVDAQFSLPYTIATAAVKRRVGLGDFTPEAIRDPAVLEMAQRVNVRLNPEFNPLDFHPGITEIMTKGGKAFSMRVDVPYGNPEKPIPQEGLLQKFAECASYAIKPLPKKNLKRVVEMIMKLEDLEDMASLVRLLS
ncbi:MAG: MmgE/PrpD family protein [Chloroflexi bacterium]|nr:MmgE/PrpD family protein [Chloroflexota bacterium]